MAYRVKYLPFVGSRRLYGLPLPRGYVALCSVVVVTVGGRTPGNILSPRNAWASESDSGVETAMKAEQLTNEFEVDAESSRRFEGGQGTVAVMANSVFRLRSQGPSGAGRPSAMALLNCKCDFETGSCRACELPEDRDERTTRGQWAVMHVTNRGDASTIRTELNGPQGTISLDSLPSDPQSSEGALVYWRYWKDLKDLPPVVGTRTDGPATAVFRGRIVALGLDGNGGAMGEGDVSSLLSRASTLERAAAEAITLLEMPPVASQLAAAATVDLRHFELVDFVPGGPGDHPRDPPRPFDPTHRGALIGVSRSRPEFSVGVGIPLGGLPMGPTVNVGRVPLGRIGR